MAVGTQVKQWQTEGRARATRSRRWIAAAATAIAAAGAGTGIFVATNGSEPATSIVNSVNVPYVDPGVDARQDALKRYHQDNLSGAIVRDTTPANNDPQAALKRYHEDNLGR